MSNFCDMPGLQDVDRKPIISEATNVRVEKDLRDIKRQLNTIIIDTQNMKSDIAIIKEAIMKRQSASISKGWYFF
jgi:hypothetical protein